MRWRVVWPLAAAATPTSAHRNRLAIRSETEPMGSRRPPTLDPKLDVVFKLLFADEQNRPLLVSFLTAVLQPPEPIDVARVAL
jgi:hypothetical protein